MSIPSHLSQRTFICLTSIIALSWILFKNSATAQIVPDKTLPVNSKVTPGCTNCTIDGGTVRGVNLFHSFREFSVKTGGEAFFNNRLDIHNILTRVTGHKISNIDGLIRAEGSANLFFVNPNGIIFGANARLDIGGSFIGSTADSILFLNDVKFSATDANTPTTLSINVPLGLQYGPNPGDIVVNGAGNQLRFDSSTFAVKRTPPTTGLRVKSGQLLALVGGNVSLTGGNLTAGEGRIELGGVNGGTVKLTPGNAGWKLNYKDVTDFQDISLSSGLTSSPNSSVRTGASVDVSGNSGGTIQVQGKRISISNGSAMLADTLGKGTGGSLILQATESLEVSGTSTPPIPFMSYLSTDVVPGATGVGGNLTIKTKTLLLTDGGQISTGTFGEGNAGTMDIKAEDVQISGASAFGPSGLFAPVATIAKGAGGNILLNTNRLQITGGGQIQTLTSGVGNAGNLNVNAQEVELVGTIINDHGEFSSGLFVNVQRGATGNGGNLALAANTVKLKDGARITASTSGSGNAGSLTITTPQLTLSDRSQVNVSSNGIGISGLLLISADTVTLDNQAKISAATQSGIGGNISLQHLQTLQLNQNSQISASTVDGKAGNINIHASDAIRLKNQSNITAQSTKGGIAGSLTVNTQQLSVTNNSDITVSSPSGQAGNLSITTDKLYLNQGKLTAETGVGEGLEGANITLIVKDLLQIQDNSIISAEAFNTANGGNITINNSNSFIVGSGNSDIIANAQQGNGGNINITTQGIFGLQFRSQLTPDNDISASSQFGVNGNVTINQLSIDLSSSLVELSTTLVNSSQQMVAGCTATKDSNFVITGRRGLPSSPNDLFTGKQALVDVFSPVAGSTNIQQVQNPRSKDENSTQQLVEVQGWVMDSNGQVHLVAEVPSATPYNSGMSQADCQTATGQ